MRFDFFARVNGAASLAALLISLPGRAQGQASAPGVLRPVLLGAQVTTVSQASGRDRRTSASAGLYGGMWLTRHAQFYLDGEYLTGGVIGHGRGFGGEPNGDAIAPDPGAEALRPYVARAWLRLTVPLGDEVEDVARGVGQLPGSQPASRVDIKVGRMAATDDFDPNRYGNNARQQFLNIGLSENTAWDYAADVHGFANGMAVALIEPRWSLRVGSYLMPIDPPFRGGVSRLQSRGDAVQLSADLGARHTLVRVMGFHDVGRMSRYTDAILVARGNPPSLESVALSGQQKFGGAINVEQPLSPHGNFGVLARAGANDGHSDGFTTAEVDRHVSMATQYRLRRVPHRALDYVGVGIARHWLSAEHRDFLERGGTGFFLDGGARTGPETIAEAYYRAQLGQWVQLSLDGQRVRDAGYVRGRGAVTVVGVRAHVEY